MLCDTSVTKEVGSTSSTLHRFQARKMHPPHCELFRENTLGTLNIHSCCLFSTRWFSTFFCTMLTENSVTHPWREFYKFTPFSLIMVLITVLTVGCTQRWGKNGLTFFQKHTHSGMLLFFFDQLQFFSKKKT